VDALAGAIVGGVLTGVAGFLGVLYVRGKDKDDEHTRFLGAVKVVLDELAANETNMAALLGQAIGRLEVYDSTYRGVELLLANYIRRDDRRLLAQAYAPVRSLWAAEDSSDSPTGYWRLGETTGTTAVAQVGPSGTYSGSYQLGQPGAIPTDASPSVRFLSTGTVSLTSLNVNVATGLQTTVEFWMYWLGGSADGMPFGFTGYDLYLYPAYGFGFNTANADLYGIPTAAVSSNTWIHVAAVFTNGSVTSNQLYLNDCDLQHRLRTAARPSGLEYHNRHVGRHAPGPSQRA
jgi:hypothetical protein